MLPKHAESSPVTVVDPTLATPQQRVHPRPCNKRRRETASQQADGNQTLCGGCPQTPQGNLPRRTGSRGSKPPAPGVACRKTAFRGRDPPTRTPEFGRSSRAPAKLFLRVLPTADVLRARSHPCFRLPQRIRVPRRGFDVLLVSRQVFPQQVHHLELLLPGHFLQIQGHSGESLPDFRRGAMPFAEWTNAPVGRPAALRSTPDDESGTGGGWHKGFGVRPSSGAATALCSWVGEQTTDLWKLNITAPEDGRTPARSVFYPCFIRGETHFLVRLTPATGAGGSSARRESRWRWPHPQPPENRTSPPPRSPLRFRRRGGSPRAGESRPPPAPCRRSTPV